MKPLRPIQPGDELTRERVLELWNAVAELRDLAVESVHMPLWRSGRTLGASVPLEGLAAEEPDGSGTSLANVFERWVCVDPQDRIGYIDLDSPDMLGRELQTCLYRSPTDAANSDCYIEWEPGTSSKKFIWFNAGDCAVDGEGVDPAINPQGPEATDLVLSVNDIGKAVCDTSTGKLYLQLTAVPAAVMQFKVICHYTKQEIAPDMICDMCLCWTEGRPPGPVTVTGGGCPAIAPQLHRTIPFGSTYYSGDPPTVIHNDSGYSSNSESCTWTWSTWLDDYPGVPINDAYPEELIPRCQHQVYVVYTKATKAWRLRVAVDGWIVNPAWSPESEEDHYVPYSLWWDQSDQNPGFTCDSNNRLTGSATIALPVLHSGQPPCHVALPGGGLEGYLPVVIRF